MEDKKINKIKMIIVYIGMLLLGWFCNRMDPIFIVIIAYVLGTIAGSTFEKKEKKDE